ncbi:DUF6340 family protein [Massilibacteroides sp.]|uniref:DUF6340 family protein n=1 Tax=Massilibacteroides sp. TaxID=2034766 RepID=UPI00261DF42B|nr:DUF6340 family protein [Massilibacteroides sp.]MDD4514059.1 DUF6340 family protein [Massilibacteroides sp.]
MKNALLLTLLVVILSSCNTINYINIETHKPAEITFPSRVNTILIVNNAVPQPEKVGYEYKYMNATQDTARAKADSALFDAGRALGLAILETDYFSDVRLFNESTRTDDQYITDKKLTKETVQTLCEETQTDAIISIDRLLFDMTKVVTAMPNGFFVGFINVKIAGVIRAYLPERNNSLATVFLNDSVFWAEEGGSLEELNAYLPSPENALREAAKYIGELASPNFVPHWQNEMRWFYTGPTTEWKRATAYANTQRWDAAESVWLSMFEKITNEKNKAKIASNLAFAKEMQGDYQEALKWAEKARDFFKNKGDDSKDANLLEQYVIVLKERIKENKVLNIQFEET